MITKNNGVSPLQNVVEKTLIIKTLIIQLMKELLTKKKKTNERVKNL